MLPELVAVCRYWLLWKRCRIGSKQRMAHFALFWNSCTRPALASERCVEKTKQAHCVGVIVSESLCLLNASFFAANSLGSSPWQAVSA